MGGVVFLFPGQGSQYAGMGRELADSFSAARGVFDEADRTLGFSISELCFTGPEEALKLTENTQPALLTASVAAYRVLEEKGVRPDYVAGHSLGEYSALVAAGALNFADALRLVRRRGQYMQEAVPPGEGAMAAILGMRPGQVAEICRKVSDGKVAPANLNSPDQTVISGHAAAVRSAVQQASADGAKRAVVLPVSAPFHSELMRPAQERLEKDLRGTQFSPLRIPLVTNVDAGIITTGAEAREALIRQVTLPVRWEESIRELVEQGATTFVEVGPGRVLSGLLRQIDRSVHSLNVEDVKSLQTALERLAQMRGEGADTEAS
jgi:[acyl-carrier-protein] S-malonyltransferase